MGSLYRSQHEFVFVYKNGTAPHINNIQLGRHGRNRTNIWNYPGAAGFAKSNEADLSLHPTPKPISLVADAILDCSKRGGIVLDAFAGSGATLLAAEKTGRRSYLMELDPHYADVIIKRFEDSLREKATQVDNGLDFETLRKKRMKGPHDGTSKDRKGKGR